MHDESIPKSHHNPSITHSGFNHLQKDPLVSAWGFGGLLTTSYNRCWTNNYFKYARLVKKILILVCERLCRDFYFNSLSCSHMKVRRVFFKRIGKMPRIYWKSIEFHVSEWFFLPPLEKSSQMTNLEFQENVKETYSFSRLAIPSFKQFNQAPMALILPVLL